MTLGLSASPINAELPNKPNAGYRLTPILQSWTHHLELSNHFRVGCPDGERRVVGMLGFGGTRRREGWLGTLCRPCCGAANAVQLKHLTLEFQRFGRLRAGRNAPRTGLILQQSRQLSTGKLLADGIEPYPRFPLSH